MASRRGLVLSASHAIKLRLPHLQSLRFFRRTLGSHPLVAEWALKNLRNVLTEGFKNGLP